jgi:hypothetical protein
VRPPPKLAEPERPHLSLVGTIAGEIEGIGVFIDQETKKTVRLKMGEAHSGWALSGIKAREVTLKKDRATAVLGLPQPGGKEAGTVRLDTETRHSQANPCNPFAAAVTSQDPFEAARRQRPANPFESGLSQQNPFGASQQSGSPPLTTPSNPFNRPPPARPDNPFARANPQLPTGNPLNPSGLGK